MTTPVTDLHRALAEVAYAAVREAYDRADRIEAIAQALAEKMPGWMPIATAPKDGTAILAGWFGSKERVVVRWQKNAWLTVPGDWTKWPSNWQPLPESP